jgi:hypothetical protein
MVDHLCAYAIACTAFRLCCPRLFGSWSERRVHLGPLPGRALTWSYEAGSGRFKIKCNCVCVISFANLPN